MRFFYAKPIFDEIEFIFWPNSKTNNHAIPPTVYDCLQLKV